MPTTLEAVKDPLPEPRYITVPIAQRASNLGKTSIYNIIRNPENNIRTVAFSTSKKRKKKVRLINYADFVAFLDRLPRDLDEARVSTPKQASITNFKKGAASS